MNTIHDRARQILEAEAQAILSVPITDGLEQAVAVIEACQGKVITTGMGKAGFVAQKFAAVLCSTGTHAAFSTSGKTREVIEMIELSRHLGPHKIIAVTSHPDSEMRPLCDIAIDMGIITEPCSLSLTPTASMAVMSAISDVLALVVMERRGFTKREYGLRHHGGYLGARARLDNS
jgi:arabinose-5-phosphate isomerase